MKGVLFIHILKVRFCSFLQDVLNLFLAVLSMVFDYFNQRDFVFGIYLVYEALVFEQNHDEFVLIVLGGVEDGQGFG